MSDLALKIENLSKRYRIGVLEERSETLLGTAASFLSRPLRNLRRLRSLTRFSDDEADSTIWALRDVSFTVNHGEVVGIIGANGAGKTTLLKILSRITFPTRGRAEIYGRVSSLLEVGTGFHPELTGRENVYLNGAILGMRKQEIDRKFDAIVDFSGIEKFIDTPSKRYSSGMRVRLAFAVSAFLEPEIFLIDEVLSVGDAEFQKRCLGKMEEASAAGRTVLLVSHQMPSISALCDRVILFEKGEVKRDGPAAEVISHYLSSGADLDDRPWVEIPPEARSDRATGQIRLLRWCAVDGQLGQGARSRSLKPCEIRIDYEAAAGANLARVDVGIVLRDVLGTPLTSASTHLLNRQFPEIPSAGTFVFKLPHVPFVPGTFRLDVRCWIKGLPADWVPDAGRFEVLPADPYGTGRMPDPRKEGSFIIKDFSWEVADSDLPPAATR